VQKTYGSKYPYLEAQGKEVIDNAFLKNFSVITTLEGFDTKHDLFILRDMLKYASDTGVSVVFEPKVKDSNGR